MTKALESQLRQRYPVLTAGLEFGFECGDGWFSTLKRMLEQLEPYEVRLVQVKRKFRDLCVYYELPHRGSADAVREIVSEAMQRARIRCDRCGMGDWSGLSGPCRGCAV